MLDLAGVIPGHALFHHIGYATTSIARDLTFFSLLGYHQEGEAFTDPIQGVNGCFLVGGGPRVELLENLADSTTLTPWLNTGVKMYHFAYEVENLVNAIVWARHQRARIVCEPVAAAAFEGRQICFAMLRSGLLVELIQK